jgi:hypothetical protein
LSVSFRSFGSIRLSQAGCQRVPRLAKAIQRAVRQGVAMLTAARETGAGDFLTVEKLNLVD